MDPFIQIKLALYEHVAQSGEMPDVPLLASKTGYANEVVVRTFQELAEQRLLVLEPGSESRIRMAPPFSAIETSFLVRADGQSYYANCVWDAYGILAALRQDGEVYTACGFSNEPIQLSVRDGQPSAQDCVAHFAVPAANWWDDIIYT